jgi:hypothetical protein
MNLFVGISTKTGTSASDIPVSIINYYFIRGLPWL